MGAWIETGYAEHLGTGVCCRSLMGAWIETKEEREFYKAMQSLPYGSVD